MKPTKYSTEKKKYVHLAEKDRYKLEVLLEGRKKAQEIAGILGKDKSTIYREITRGTVSRLQSDLTRKDQYRADVAQANYEKLGKNKERTLKIGKDSRLEEYIRKKLVGDKFSPDAIIGEIKEKKLKFKGMICTKTLYNYIDEGIFSGISNENLWEKRKRKKRRYRTIARVSRQNRMARSIEDRPEAVNDRTEYGHWEGDCVKGPLGKKVSLFTLTERKTLEEIIVKIGQATQEGVQKALDGLEMKCGAEFKRKFKTLTFDNGVEFLNWESLEGSVLEPGVQRTTTYFAHAYSSWERGSNENQNRMIRRFIPKGTDIANVSEREIKVIETWMNNYPRKLLGYKTAKEMAKTCLQDNSDLDLETVAL